MLRQRGILCYARCNNLIRKLSSCSLNVKVFKTLCCIMYCCQIWIQYKKDTFRKLKVGYNHAFRRMKDDGTCSASGMFVANDVMSFYEIWRKSLYNFRQRVTQSNNIIPDPPLRSGRTVMVWCKYVIIMCTCIGHIHLLAIMCFKKMYTTMAECVIFYGPIVPEINYSIIFLF